MKNEKQHYLYGNEWYQNEQHQIVHIVRDDYCGDPHTEFDDIGKILPVRGRYSISNNETDYEDINDLFYHYYADAYDDQDLSIEEQIELIEKAAEEDGDIVIDYYFQGYDYYEEILYIMTKEEIEAQRMSREQAEKIMYAELETRNHWIKDECYGYGLYNLGGESIDSCYGFIGSTAEETGIEDYCGELTEYLGEYDSIEECIEKNAEKLGLEIYEETIMMPTIRKSYRQKAFTLQAAT